MDSSYLQLIVEVAVTVYVFLLGLPVLVNQIFLPEDLRRMSKRNYTGNVRWDVLVLTILLILILGIAYWGSLRPKGYDFTTLDLIVTIMFGVMLLITLAFLYRQLIRSQGYRAKIIEVIRKEILKGFRRTGKLDKAYLDDLEHLGIYSNRGMETANVIKALEEILNHILESNQDYLNNNALSLLIDTLCHSVTNSVEPGSRKNMVQVLTIYKSILMDLKSHSSPNNQLIRGKESLKIKECSFKIAQTSLKLEYADMMPLVLNVLTLIPGSSDKLFIIGIMALDARHFNIATNVLSEIMDRDNKDPVKLYNYLGLVAHFHDAGPTACRLAKRSLKINRIEIKNTLLEKALRHHLGQSNFTTVDKMEALWKASS